MTSTIHAAIRQQQRGIPPFIVELLESYGKELYNGDGTLTLCFDHKSKKSMAKELGRPIVQKLECYLNAYLVECNSTGIIITASWRNGRMKEKRRTRRHGRQSIRH